MFKYELKSGVLYEQNCNSNRYKQQYDAGGSGELPEDVRAALESARAGEPWPLAKKSLGILCENLTLAREKCLPICQDTGLACDF